MDYETALIHFSKVIFYDKNIPEVYAEKAEIYIKLCDFSSAIQQFKTQKSPLTAVGGFLAFQDESTLLYERPDFDRRRLLQ